MWQHYCLVKRVQQSDLGLPDDAYSGPDLPDDVRFLLLADPGLSAPWGLYACDLSDDEPLPLSVTLVPPAVAGLIYSGEMYPPALALARDAVEDACVGRNIAPDTFLEMYTTLLRGYLKAQPTSGYLFVEAVRGQVGYMTPGCFYWVVGYDGNTEVQWVSSDFNMYTDPLSYFRLERQAVAHLSWIQHGRARSL